jgi:tRNA 2-thiouridine synthesizing protein A
MPPRIGFIQVSNRRSAAKSARRHLPVCHGRACPREWDERRPARRAVPHRFVAAVLQNRWPSGLPASLAQPRGHAHLAAMSETLLDVKGMNCPLPVLKANRALRGMAAGQRLRVLATDPAAVGDFQAFCRETGHALLAWSEEAGVFSFVIRRRVDDPDKKGS